MAKIRIDKYTYISLYRETDVSIYTYIYIYMCIYIYIYIYIKLMHSRPGGLAVERKPYLLPPCVVCWCLAFHVLIGLAKRLVQTHGDSR